MSLSRSEQTEVEGLSVWHPRAQLEATPSNPFTQWDSPPALSLGTSYPLKVVLARDLEP